MNKLEIRKLAVGDIEALQQIDRLAHGVSWSRRTFLDQVDEPDQLHLVGAYGDGLVVGHAAAMLDGNVGRVTNVAMDRHHHGRGCGSQLFMTLLDSVLLWTGLDSLALEVRSDNLTAQRLYRRFGFAPVGFHRNFYESSPRSESRDALVMVVDTPRSSDWLVRLETIKRHAVTEERNDHQGAAA